MSVLFPLLFFSGLLLAANRLAASENEAYRRFFDLSLLMLNLAMFLAGLILTLTPAGPVAAVQLGDTVLLQNKLAAGATLLGMAVWGVAASLPAIRQTVARRIPIDPTSPVHTLALTLSGLLVGSTLFTLTQGGLQELAATAGPASISGIVGQFLLFVVLALLGVGLFTRRDSEAIRQRLGLEWPHRRQLLVGVRWIVLLVLVQWAFGAVGTLLNPGQLELLDDIGSSLLGEIDTVWEWFILALATGIGEELLFRGALQPVLGLRFTAALFAIAHVQYGVSPITLAVLVIGIALGHIRRASSTTIAIFVHAGYNFVLGILTMLATLLQ
jgi:membrane protease YdiL (CAAX protease family)